MKVVLYDGYDTIGGNKIYVQEGDNGIFLDFGHNFAKGGMYFQEFLRERSVRGINDFWKLNLIPHLNIYRRDLIPIDLSDEVRNAPNIPVSAVLITHAHTDHAGNAALLDEDIYVVASPITIALLKTSLDTGSNSNIGSEIPYYNS
ncbi:MAG TPA: MBL fold metallo-hydrolase, partial [Euryarchaeota archaeon]|nr:MBL fold metallo-hydrolase [Euryarchaeota archaeon]